MGSTNDMRADFDNSVTSTPSEILDDEEHIPCPNMFSDEKRKSTDSYFEIKNPLCLRFEKREATDYDIMPETPKQGLWKPDMNEFRKAIQSLAYQSPWGAQHVPNFDYIDTRVSAVQESKKRYIDKAYNQLIQRSDSKTW